MNNLAYVGIVRQKALIPLLTERPTGPSLRLTSIATNAAQAPESAEIPLTEYEGIVLLVRGIDSGAWIYSAVVIEQASQIVSLLAQVVLSKPINPGEYGIKLSSR